MRRRIPSLAALEAFEVVARLGSTTRAADELGRSQSAVSRQILNLESYIRQPLFDRLNGGLVLNETGRYLSEAVGVALVRIEHAVDRASRLREGLNKKLVLRVWPTFGARWLSSRLAQLSLEDTGFEVELSVGLELKPDLRAIGADAAIIYGKGDWPDHASFLVAEEELIAVTSPHAYNQHGRDLEAYDWLHMDGRLSAWARWLAARGPEGAAVKEGRRFQVNLLIEMVCLGQGATVLPKLYIERELTSGQLIAPFGEPLVTGRGYFLTCLKEDGSNREIRTLRNLLTSSR